MFYCFTISFHIQAVNSYGFVIIQWNQIKLEQGYLEDNVFSQGYSSTFI